ncbi:hypothetical protein BKA58DRAFT_378651 [Alternaria rosae]|uniref:uncharacterized protein n=1 Tax=Alternaria rosae TaxID=1187941 RepID=UPI001E8E732C|nr:uncharacterized protein BKA58DRAFT_378651 [Alternaria rosae]KAH6879111.1 hypothetical protein BKA58DRAFT_378651 [Alternaria rosae]
MNTFFPALQLFFESGSSCTIDCGRFPDASLGLDPALRFRLTDCAHEEEGRVVNSILPRRFAHSGTGLVIQEAVIAQRTSIVFKKLLYPQKVQLWRPGIVVQPKITKEVHTVVGLRLRGMNKTAYIWAKTAVPSGGRVWGDVRSSGLRDDVPVPILPSVEEGEPGAQRVVVIKDSLIARNRLGDRDMGTFEAITPEESE